MTQALKDLFDQALKAINGLYSVFSRLKLNMKSKLMLFDRMISPILLFCSEILGTCNTFLIEMVHIKFCKKILNPNINYFPMLQKRIRDQFQQDWHSSIISTTKLDYYVRFKKRI